MKYAWVMEKIGSVSIRRFVFASPQDLGNTSQDFGVVEVFQMSLFGRMRGEYLSRLKEFAPQNLTNIARGSAKLCIRGTLVLDGSIDTQIRETSWCGSQNLSMSAWMPSVAGVFNEALSLAIASQASGGMPDLGPQEMTNVVRVMVAGCVLERRLLRAIADEVSVDISRLGAQELGNLVWSFAKLSTEEPRLLGVTINAFLFRASELAPQSLSNAK